jgi:hypothetical protein
LAVIKNPAFNIVNKYKSILGLLKNNGYVYVYGIRKNYTEKEVYHRCCMLPRRTIEKSALPFTEALADFSFR